MGGGETRYIEMDFFQLSKIIFDRVQKLEPDNFCKIVGYIFFKEPGEQEMFQLAFGHDNLLLSKIHEVKVMLGILSPKSAVSAQIQSVPDPSNQFNAFPPVSRTISSHASFHAPCPFWEPQVASGQHTPIQNVDFVHRPYIDSVVEDYALRNQSHFLGLEEQLDPTNPLVSYYYSDAAMAGGLPSRASRRTSSLPEFSSKPCHYHFKGHCKHGANCRFLHGQANLDDYSTMYGPNMNELANEDNGFLPGSLERLEMEITEILRSKKGMPVSIASLPMMYFEKYGKNLQAEGYLTESQRHGKAGFSLTKLLARLRSIRLIDRPHGQHSVILAEDAPRFMEYRNERNDPGAIVASSHQIYLTFPADSTFTEEDVSNYFMQYGPVRDVRIPCQDKRMFGFVSFHQSETVEQILRKRNPHYICSARVLVKPYREKSKMVDRTYMDKIRSSMYQHSHYLEMDHELHSIPIELDRSRLLRKHLMEEHEKIIELERRRLSEFNLVQKPLAQPSHFNYGFEELKAPEGPNEFPLADHFSYTLDSLNNGSTSDDKARHTSNNFSDQESQIDLPDSPFASPPLGSSISTVM